MEDIERLALFASLVAGVLAVGASFVWVLGPLNRAARNRPCSIQYRLADLLCLFVLVQLPIGIVHWGSFGTLLQPAEITADVLIGLFVAVLWWDTARTLSRAGVHTVWRRCIVLTVAMPGVILGPLALIVLLFVGLGAGDFRVLLAAVFVVGILYALGRFTRATVASAEKRA